MSETTEHWDMVAACVDAYAAMLISGQTPPGFESILPDEPKAVRSLAIVELAKLQMERLADLGQPFGVAQYLEEYPELRNCTGGIPIDLLIDEVRLRKQLGLCDEQEMLAMYPQHRDALKRFFSFSDTVATSPSAEPLRATQTLRVGQVIEDFELLKLLGSGAFAQVYLARQATMQRLVALKVSSDRGDEPKTLAQLDHPHIVRVFDVRSSREERLRLLSMQYAPGGTLQHVIGFAKELPWRMLSGRTILQAIDKQLLEARLPPPEESRRRQKLASSDWSEAICELGIQIASALEYAHGQRVLHRDVKPANVLLTAEASCKLADFNISFAEDLAGANPSNYFGGSLIYMSPEQLLATQWTSDFGPADLDARSDVYSLSFVLWELLTLARPWQNDQAKQDWAATVDEISQRRRSESPQVAEGVELSKPVVRLIDVLKQGLTHDREKRIGSAAEYAIQLRLCLMPKAWRLLHPESQSWSAFCCRQPLLTAAVAVFLPNILASIFNIAYNQAWLTARYQDSYWPFVRVSVFMNVISFGMGIVFFFWILGPIASQVSKRWRARSNDPSELLQQSTLACHTASIFGVSLWIMAGVLFPLLLKFSLEAFDAIDAIHFFLSLIVCGAVAVAYPFLGVGLLTLECWYGLLAGKRLDDPLFLERSRDLLRWSDRYLLAAIGVPLVGMTLLLLQPAPVRPALLALVAAGGIGLMIAFRAHRRLREAIDTLSPLLKRDQE